ncbi:TetR/AcrR family transcriptional regulator [Elongatibacter sediminis]|uniref:TetR/AcrR family transcriptional regulator n=1 Tax=Elongatibacter sediminis TaxID=3119006 RepID=A0AAW9RF44_9GAMM
MTDRSSQTTVPDSRRTQAERTALAESRMIGAAIDLLNTVGVSGATLKAIGEEAGYSRGLATHHFGGKAGLFRSLLREVHAAFLEDLHSRVGERTGLEALEAANEAHRDFVQRHRDRLRAMYILWFGALDPGSDFKPNVARFMARQRETMADWIRGGQATGEIPDHVDANRMARQIYGNLVGVNLQWLIDASLNLSEAYADMRTDMRCLLGQT